MSYTKCTVSTNSDEKTFIKTFIKKLTESDSRITCDTDIDAEFDTSKQVGITPTFTVNVGTNCNIVFTRIRSCQYEVNGYNVKICINNTEKEVYYFYSGTNFSVDSVATRSWKFVTAANESIVYLAFSYFDKDVDGATFSVMSIDGGDFSAASFGSMTDGGTDAANSELYCTDSTSQNLVLNFADRLTYDVSGGKVEFIKNKALLDINKGTKVMEFLGLFDCSTVPSYTFLRIDNEIYYALSNHTLMSC